MRTRFLATEHSIASGGDVQIIDFVRLPVPHFPASDDTSSFSDLVYSFDGIPVFDVSREVNKLPTDDALSMFLSDVLPHYADGADSVERKLGRSTENMEVPQSEAKIETMSTKKGNDIEFLLFEIPDLDISLLSLPQITIYSQMESLYTSVDISDAACETDLLHAELRPHGCLEIQQSVSSIDDVIMEHSIEKHGDLLDNTYSVQGQLQPHITNFPLFEVGVENLSTFGRVCVEDEHLGFENIETLQLTLLDDVISNKELLGCVEIDLMVYMSHQFVPVQLIEETESSSLHLDYISILESHFPEYPSFYQGNPDDLICPTNPVFYDDFQFLDMDICNLCEVFSDAGKEIETETCESMFGESMEFRNFNELIVCHELTLMDDSFKSLPVPIFLDSGNPNSFSSLVEGILSSLDLQSSLASDGLFLDWHFFEEGDCDSVTYSSCRKMLWAIDRYNTDAISTFRGNEKLIIDYILSEDHSKEQCVENQKEMLNLPFSDISVVHTSPHSGKLDSNRLRSHGNGKTGNDVEQFALFGESMSNDLNFFMNPLNHYSERENIVADKSMEPITACQVHIPSDNFIATNATTGIQQHLNNKFHEKGDLHSTSTQEQSKTELEGFSNILPVHETGYNECVKTVKGDEACVVIPNQYLPVGLESKKNLSCEPLFVDTIIIVNTRNFADEMVISRRSTYQKILEMEKEGAQVVERDICLPIDIIASAAVCFSWYDCKNIGKKASAPDEAFSCLPLCVESIATSILTSLSFAFGCCILIFEGEGDFLGSIMESSDELYAASASLGIDIQVFYSSTSEMTEEIIFSSISIASKMSRGLYPKMPDSESLIESFLTTFPSINHLSAHAILSSDAILSKFMELSTKDRLSVLKKYQVPEASVTLFSAISRYGEREDSKSGLTECSSVSSILESENVQLKCSSERKKPKYSHNFHHPEEPSNDLLHLESLKLPPDDKLLSINISMPCGSWMSENSEIFDELEKFNIPLDDKSINCSLGSIKKSAGNSKPCDFPNVLQMPDKGGNSWMPPIDIDYQSNWRSTTAEMNDFGIESTKVFNHSQENFKGEVINVKDTRAFRENSFVPNLDVFSTYPVDVDKGNAERNLWSKASLNTNNLDMFKYPVQINSACDVWTQSKDGKILGDENRPHFNTVNSNRNSVQLQQKLLKENMQVNTARSFSKLPFQETGSRGHGDTTLSNALSSTQLQQGSPWTIEFLNRIREKSRLRRQSISYNISSPRLDSSGNTSKVTKTKSPSIIESFKFGGGSTSKRIGEQKRQKRLSQQSTSLKNENVSASCPPSWTPVDKRARRMLSFASKGSGGQSKLVWTEKSNIETRRF